MADENNTKNCIWMSLVFICDMHFYKFIFYFSQMVRRKMDAGQQLKENNLNPSSVHTDNHETTLVNSDQPTSSPSHTVPDSPNNSKCDSQPHTKKCLQRKDNDCICGSVTSHTDAQSNSSDLISIDQLVPETDDEAQRALIQRNSSIPLLSVPEGYEHHGSNSNRIESDLNSERGRERGLNSDPYNTKFSLKIIPSFQHSTTLNEDYFDRISKEVILNPSTHFILGEEKTIKKHISANKHHSANTKKLSLTDCIYGSNIANVAVTEVSGNVKRQISSHIPNKLSVQPIYNDESCDIPFGQRSFSSEKNPNPNIDNRQVRDDDSALYIVPAGKCSDENNGVESKEIHDIDGDDQVKNIHKPNDKNATNVSKGYEVFKGNIQPKDQSCTTDVYQTPWKSPTAYHRTDRKIKTKAKLRFVPVYIKGKKAYC